MNYSKAIKASPVRFPALLELNAMCYRVGKRPSAALPLRRQRPLKLRQSAKINIFSASVDTISKGWRVTYNEFFSNFSQYASHVFRSLINKQFPIRHCTKSAQCCAIGIFVPMDSLTTLRCAVACRQPANSACCVRRTTYEISLLSAQMAARIVAQVERLRHAHTCARSISEARIRVGTAYLTRWPKFGRKIDFSTV